MFGIWFAIWCFTGKRTVKRFKYSPLGIEWKKQKTYNVKRQYQGLNKVHGFDKEGNFEKCSNENYKKSDLNYDSRLLATLVPSWF